MDKRKTLKILQHVERILDRMHKKKRYDYADYCEMKKLLEILMDDKTPLKKCEDCGREFRVVHGNQRFCSKCSQNAKRVAACRKRKNVNPA